VSELVFEALDLEALGDVRCAVSRVRVDGVAVLVLAYRGTYRDGSQGTPDAGRMRADAVAALSVWSEDAVVFDFRELRYRWGNGMISVFAAEPPETLDPIASAVVVGPDSRAGLASLCKPEALFESLEVAVRVVAEQARAAAAERDRVEDLLTLAIVLRADLPAGAAVRVAARAMIVAREHMASDWRMRLWIVGAYRTVVLAGTAEDLEWVRKELDGIGVRDPEGGGEVVGVVAAPLAELPERLAGLARFGG
jgi:hypothetical protein